MKKTIFFLLLLVLCFKTLLADTRGIQNVEIKDISGETVGLYEESHALVIGVSDYKEWPKLPGVKKDVSNVVFALKQQGFKVETVLDPDKNTLVEAFEAFIEAHGARPENRLLFYFAGHGNTVKPKFGGDPMGYLVPIDAPIPTLGNAQESSFKRKAINMKRIEEYALSIDAKHALFIFDACFSGSLFALSRAIPESISYKTNRPVRQFITSGSADELVPDKSIFSEQFVYGLQGDADANNDGYITGTELGEFLQDTVVNYSKGAQHPQYGKIRDPRLDKGDFVFTISKAEPKNFSKELLAAALSVPEKKEFRADEEAWKLVKDSEEVEDFQEFLYLFPNSTLAGVAKLKIWKQERQLAKIEEEQQKLKEEKKGQILENKRLAELKRKKPKKITGLRKQKLYRSYIGQIWRKVGDEKEDYIYVGETVNGVPNGIGTETFPNGSKYDGEWKNSEPDGQGTLIQGKGPFEGDMYVGGFKNGEFNFYGTYNYSSGHKYEGEFKEGKQNGLGTYTWKDGAKYEGEFKDDKHHGHGKYTYPNGTIYEGQYNEGETTRGETTFSDGNKYIGDHRNGRLHGHGTMYINAEGKNKGDRYIGEYKNDKKHGKGKYIFSNGQTYEGEYKEGSATGIGTSTFPNGDTYVGEHKDGKSYGFGKYTVGSGAYSGDIYEGEIGEKNVWHGHGKYMWTDGRIYEGTYKNGKKHGKGKLTWPGGDMYNGDFRDDLINGRGKYIWTNGDMYVGEWKDSKRHGEGTYYFVGENGAIEVGEHKNGEPWDITRYNKKGTILGKFVDGIYIRE